MSETIEDLVLRLAIERGAGKTICPTEAARAAAEQRGEDHWQGRLPAVKAAAVRLAKRGRVSIYRKGKPVDPDGVKGIYRIGLPTESEGADDTEVLVPALSPDPETAPPEG